MAMRVHNAEQPCRMCEGLFRPKNKKHVFCQDACYSMFRYHFDMIREDAKTIELVTNALSPYDMVTQLVRKRAKL